MKIHNLYLIGALLSVCNSFAMESIEQETDKSTIIGNKMKALKSFVDEENFCSEYKTKVYELSDIFNNILF